MRPLSASGMQANPNLSETQVPTLPATSNQSMNEVKRELQLPAHKNFESPKLETPIMEPHAGALK